MIYYLHLLSDFFGGLNVFRYVTFRAACGAVASLATVLALMPILIRWMRARGLGEDASKPDAPALDELHRHKTSTPTMGGLVVIGACIVNALLWCDAANRHVLMGVFTMLALAGVGFLDDWLKLVRGSGLTIWRKFLLQAIVGACVVAFLFAHGGGFWLDSSGAPHPSSDVSLPFFKASIFLPRMGFVFSLLALLILVGSSNAVNLTDGLDGLAGGCGFAAVAAFSILSYAAGHVGFASYLYVPFVRGAEELTIVGACACGALLGFLWFNAHPAQVFMGDTGSLALGGLLGFLALATKQEFLLALVGGIFVLEALSVIAQVLSFRLLGRRVLPMAPFHHTLQLLGWAETKIVVRFWIAAGVLALAGVVSLKVR